MQIGNLKFKIFNLQFFLTGLTPPLLTQSKEWKILRNPIIELSVSKGAGLTKLPRNAKRRRSETSPDMNCRRLTVNGDEARIENRKSVIGNEARIVKGHTLWERLPSRDKESRLGNLSHTPQRNEHRNRWTFDGL
jgi:hypothetical protein